MFKFVLLFFCFSSVAATTLSKPINTPIPLSYQKISVFIDCRGCSSNYIRTEVTFVNYVRDKEDADVHLLVTRQRTGSGGQEYTIQLMGSKQFAGQDNTLKYISAESDTDDEEREGLVKFIRIGLIPYLSGSDVLSNLNVTYEPDEAIDLEPLHDPWNNWIFEIDLNTYFNGEESRKNYNLRGGIEAQKITPLWKIRLDYNQSYNRQSFTDEGVTSIYVTESNWYNGYAVKSINDHWSAGIFTEVSSSTRSNMDISFSGSPAIEYNIFPYYEYTRREVSFSYHISTGYFDYRETTIFGKNHEVLLRHQLRSRMEFTQPWGEVEGRINAYAYLHDPNKNRLDVNMSIDVRVFRGLSVRASGRYSWINDQLSIPAGDIDDAELLLNLRQQATSYSFGGSVGIQYTFGSIFNNTVNPRF